jgi:ABC-type thiamine transport system ATPase subunit
MPLKIFRSSRRCYKQTVQRKNCAAVQSGVKHGFAGFPQGRERFSTILTSGLKKVNSSPFLAPGCGKTTLLRTIAGFARPFAGSIQVSGREVTQLPPDKRGMALVFQSYALWLHMTVAQNIGYGLKLQKRSRSEIDARVAEMQTLLGLSGLGNRKPGQLSGGQRQRVALRRALAIDPEILLLDESPISTRASG